MSISAEPRRARVDYRDITAFQEPLLKKLVDARPPVPGADRNILVRTATGGGDPPPRLPKRPSPKTGHLRLRTLGREDARKDSKPFRNRHLRHLRIDRSLRPGSTSVIPGLSYYRKAVYGWPASGPPNASGFGVFGVGALICSNSLGELCGKRGQFPFDLLTFVVVKG